MEILDVTDKDDNVVARLPKDEAIRSGYYCRVVFVIIRNSKGELYLQQRKATKKTYPLYWSGSAAGHVRSGESYEAAALRELEEELGVRTELQEIGRTISGADMEHVVFFTGEHEGPFDLEWEAIETAEFFTEDRLKAEGASMKMTSYLVTALSLLAGPA